MISRNKKCSRRLLPAGDGRSSSPALKTPCGGKPNGVSEADDNLAALDTDNEDKEGGRPELPPADFDFLVYSLRIHAELNLGLLPFDDKRKPDFERGRHNIDLLAMLQEKTKGNLSMEEKRSLDNSVAELRFSLVSCQRDAGKR